MRLIWVGRHRKQSAESDLCQRYRSRIQKMAAWSEQVIKPHAGDDAVERESKQILRGLHSHAQVVLLDVLGKPMETARFASWIGTRIDTGTEINFIIGGAHGVNSDVNHRADLVLSLSKMTLPHGLARVVLLEQVYRALCIRANHPYHHA